MSHFDRTARALFILGCVTLLIAEIAPRLSIGFAPSQGFPVLIRSDPVLNSACLGVFVTWLFVAPGRAVALASVGVGILVEALLWPLKNPALPVDVRLSATGSGFALVGAAGLCWLVLRESGESRRHHLSMLAMALVDPMFLLCGVFYQSVTIIVHRMVYDVYAFDIDSALGWHPSYAIAHFVSTHGLVNATGLVYSQLPVWLVLTRLYCGRSPEKCYNDPLLAFVLLGWVGTMLYQACPMVGIKVLSGDRFPDGTPPWYPGVPFMVDGTDYFPRNCMPSLHTAWILSVYWSSRGLGRWHRIIGNILMVLTLLAVFYWGEHYLVDVVAGVALALMAQAMTARRTAENRSIRYVGMGWGAAATLLVMAVVRFAPQWAVAHPVAVLVGEAIVVGVSVWLEGRVRTLTFASGAVS